MLYPMRWATCILLDIVRPHHFWIRSHREDIE